MFLKIRNWKLLLLALIMIMFLMKLGFWQLGRAAEKRQMLNAFHSRMSDQPLHATQINSKNLQYRRVTLQGRFDNDHTLLLDNKIYQGRVGYEIFVPFIAKGLKTPILINRGFLPAGPTRQVLPTISAVDGETTITGMLNHPPGYLKFGDMNTESKISWPLRIEYVDMAALNHIYKTTFNSYIVDLDPADTAAYPLEWQIVSMSPERHIGYAVQWFALALTLLILSIASHCHSSRKVDANG